jgi:hypothetical protein
MNNKFHKVLIINNLQKIKCQFSSLRFDIIEVLKPDVATVLTAECHANIDNLRIRRLKPPLHEVAKPKVETANVDF